LIETVEILGVNVACLDRQNLLDIGLAWCFSTDRHWIFYANAHTLNMAYVDIGYRKLLQCADLVYTDGISLVWSSRLLGGCRLHKLTGADWIFELAKKASERDIKVYFLGGRPGVAKRAADNLCRYSPSLKVVGIADGFFQSKSPLQVTKEIAAQAPNLVLVGMGAPDQEEWIAEHSQMLKSGVWWGVGALFDFLAGDESRVPAWLGQLGMEWLWRLYQDPVGKWRRYIIGNPVFIYRVLSQYLNGRER
jgi:N-acetylglucosaminyldiphosphoundecaprenol N-acetyl-beta-D-mannosaminyltransferase